MLDMNGLLLRIEAILDANGGSKRSLTDDLGISNSSFSDWHKGKGKPSLETMVKIAEYLHVSLDFLVYGKTTTSIVPTSSVVAATDKFMQLDASGQARALAFMDGMITASRESE